MTTAQENESRKFGRYNVQHSVEVLFGSDAINATIVNESIGGVRLRMESAARFAVGSKVTIRQDETDTEGYVRNVAYIDDGGMFAGVSWDPPENDVEEVAIADFFKYGQIRVVCRSREDLEGDSSRIELWDGAQFSAPTSTLAPCSRDDREKALCDTKSIAVLAELYGIGSVGSRDEIINKILDFEFGRSE